MTAKTCCTGNFRQGRDCTERGPVVQIAINAGLCLGIGLLMMVGPILEAAGLIGRWS